VITNHENIFLQGRNITLLHYR